MKEIVEETDEIKVLRSLVPFHEIVLKKYSNFKHLLILKQGDTFRWQLPYQANLHSDSQTPATLHEVRQRVPTDDRSPVSMLPYFNDFRSREDEKFKIK